MKRNFLTSDTLVYVVGVTLSLLLSLWMNMRSELINPDGICYLASAEAFGHFGLKYAINLCGQSKWPFFYILVYAIGHLISVSYEVAAYALNNFFDDEKKKEHRQKTKKIIERASPVK